jgi:flagellar basal-body rod modification protein FlgD
MTTESSFNAALLRETGSSAATKAASQTPSLDKKNSDISKNEFLTLLVTQLQNQDPLEPMKNEEFAVNLAQFSQLEQLVSINDKIASDSADLNSLAAYLGNQVTLNSDQVLVKNKDGGAVKFELGSDAASVELELVNAEGNVAKSVTMGAMTAGSQTVRLESIEVANGTYTARVKATSTAGASMTPEVHTAGIVNGFIPGPEPKLLVNGNEIDPAQIIAVHAVS